ncbi:MAG TPA: hypothetical protein VFR37_07220 [Longimicrobium sp.]|nr:hypothetical protein [Longimicrobium sp.]
MRRLAIAAALLVGAAVPAALPAQHQHGNPGRDSARTDTSHARHDSATHRRMLEADSARNRQMRPDAGHRHPPAPAPAAAPARGHDEHAPPRSMQAGAEHADARHAAGGHRMTMRPLGGGWSVMGMAQAFPIATAGLASDRPMRGTEPYLTQPAAMINVEGPGSRLVLRTTLNFEGITQPDGELTYGGWGEGFIDRRHPHTLLHELMVSVNAWNVAGGALSLSAGKGFAPYGTDDPMARPVAKYPTNHHLSQILERWTANLVYLRGPWSVEAAVFGGAEPDGPYDFSNLESFGDSWSARLIRRFGGEGTGARWEASASYGSVAELHHDEKERTSLVNGYLRHAARHRLGTLYALAEASRSEPHGEAEGYYALLGEAIAGIGRHRPYARVEYATRPEYEREAASEADGFFRYDHDAEPAGATRWLITSLGYGRHLTGYPAATMPFVEVQHHRVWGERGGIDPTLLYGDDRFWSVTAGVRVFLGSAGQMRMGSYGVLDDMTWSHRTSSRGTGQPSH